MGRAFRHTSISTEESIRKVIELQRAADRWARAGERTGEAEEADPFNQVPDLVSRVLGLQHYDYELEDEDLALMQERLPLQDGKDAHGLLLNIDRLGTLFRWNLRGLRASGGLDARQRPRSSAF